MPAVVLLAALFLVLLAVLAAVAFKLLAARDAQGNVTAPGCLNGCAIALVLALLGGLGAATFLAAAGAIAGEGPLREIGRELRERKRVRDEGRDAERNAPQPREAETREERTDGSLRVVLESPGHVDVPPELLRSLEQAGVAAELELLVDHLADESGHDVTLVEIALPASERDLGELERTFEEVLRDPERNGGSEFVLRRIEELR